MSLEIRSAGPGGGELVRAVQRMRYELLVEVGGAAYYQGLGSDEHDRHVADRLDDASTHLVAFWDGEPVGAVRSTLAGDAPLEDEDQLLLPLWLQEFRREHLAQSARFVVRPEHWGGRVSAALLEAVYVHLRERGVLVDFLDCRPELLPLYERVGYRQFRPPYLHAEAGVEFTPMVTFVEDVGYYRSVRSRVRRLAARFPADPGARLAFERLFAPRYVLPLHRVLEELPDAPFRFYNINRELASTAEAFPHRTVRAGRAVVREGDAGGSCYVVKRGVLGVSRRVDGARLDLGRLGPGHFFGELALLGGTPRSATVHALTDVELYELDRATLLGQLRLHPSLAVSMLRVLCRWYWDHPSDPSAPALPEPSLRTCLEEVPEATLPPVDQSLPRVSDEAIEALSHPAPGRRACRYAPGELLLERDTRGKRALLLRSGEVRVLLADGREVARRGRGDLVGELGALTGLPRTADVVADTEVDALELSREVLLAALQEDPELGLLLLSRVARLIYGRRARAREDDARSAQSGP